jgi:hypothetical protein
MSESEQKSTSQTSSNHRKSKRKGNRSTLVSSVSDVFSPAALTKSPWRMPPIPDSQVYRFSEVYDCPTLVSSTSAEVDQIQLFSLNALPGATSLLSAFDQYRIDHVELVIEPRVTNNMTNTTNMGRLASAVDYDSQSSTPFASLSQYNNCVSTQGIMAHYHRFKPCVLGYTENTSSASALGLNVQSPWLDCSTSNIAHFGVLMAITQTSAVFTYDIQARVFVSFRNSI